MLPVPEIRDARVRSRSESAVRYRSSDFLSSYSVWYELIPVPAEPVQLPMTVAPGDKLVARIGTNGTTTTLAIRNVTTGKSLSIQTPTPQFELSSAEWIAEAPSVCLIYCAPLRLANFGTVTFRGASASSRSDSVQALRSGLLLHPMAAGEPRRLSGVAPATSAGVETTRVPLPAPGNDRPETPLRDHSIG
jgi:Peptidase A4 family